MRIRTKLIVAVVVSMAVVAAAAGIVMRRASEANIRLNAEDAVRSAAAGLAAMERADVEKLDVALTALLADPRWRAPFLARDRAALLAATSPVFAELRARHGITHWYFHGPDGRCFLRVHKPEAHGDMVARVTLARADQTGGLGAGKELGKTAFALRAVRPWVVDGKPIGYVELGEDIDGFLGRMKAQTGDDYGLVVEKRHLDRALWAAARASAGRRDNWADLPDAVEIDATAADAAARGWSGTPAALPEDGAYLDEEAAGGRTWVRGAIPVTDASGARVGVLFARSDITRIHDNMTAARGRVLGLIALVALATAGFLVLLLNGLVFARLARMTEVLEDLAARLAGGDYEIEGAIPHPATRDEIGAFEEFFGRFLGVIAELLRALTASRR